MSVRITWGCSPLGIAIPAARLIGSPALVVAALAMSACSSAPVSTIGALDPRLAWPCDRIVLEWAIETDRLQQMVGSPLEVRQAQGVSRLQLHVMQCEPQRPGHPASKALSYAYVLVPVSGRTAPIGITGIPDDGWFALPLAVTSGAGRALLEDFGYVVIEAAQHFAINQSKGDMVVAIELKFDRGRISIVAGTTGESSYENRSTAILGRGDGFVSAYFGAEECESFTLSARVSLTGQTPLSEFNLRSTPLAAKLCRRLVSDRVYWRLPAG